jgi:hypothetical protein
VSVRCDLQIGRGWLSSSGKVKQKTLDDVELVFDKFWVGGLETPPRPALEDPSTRSSTVDKLVNVVGNAVRTPVPYGGRFATPAGFPLRDCSLYRGLHARRECLGFVHRSRTIFCRPVPNLNGPIRNCSIAVHRYLLPSTFAFFSLGRASASLLLLKRQLYAQAFLDGMAVFPVLYFNNDASICVFKFPPLNSAIAAYRVGA